MNDIVIHSVPGSPYGRAALVALEEKGVRYRVAPVAPATLRSPQHLARHPFGRIPVMEHGEFKVYECQAILRYIDRMFPGAALTPVDVRAAARMDQLMNVNDWYLFQGVGTVIPFQRIVRPRVLGLAPDESAIEAVMPKAHQVFEALSLELGEAPYFAGRDFTLADVMLAPQLDFFQATPEWQPLTAKHANLCDWLRRMQARPSMQATTWERVSVMAQVA
jgi:glutathione S-transferase